MVARAMDGKLILLLRLRNNVDSEAWCWRNVHNVDDSRRSHVRDDICTKCVLRPNTDAARMMGVDAMMNFDDGSGDLIS